MTWGDYTKKILLILICLTFTSNLVLAENLRVIDGDTIVIDGEKIRFSGIDTLELKQICIKDNKKVFCGKLVKEILIERIGSKIPSCKREGLDFYKRTLAECFVGGESLSSYLVKNGYAFAYRKYSRKFIKEEEFAKENRLGIWSMKFEFPWDFRKSLWTKLQELRYQIMKNQKG